MIEYPVLVLHNVVSSSSCIEFVKISAGMGFKTVAITQAQGSAAQRGLPAAQKIAMQNNINFFSLNSLDDIKELLKPDLMILVAPPPYGKKNLDNDFVQTLKDKRWVAIFGGNDPGIGRKDLEKGDEVVQLPAGDIGSIGTLTLGLALLTGKFSFNK